MDAPTNIEEYIQKSKCDSVEVKILKTEIRGIRYFYVQYLATTRKWYRFWKKTSEFRTLCYKDGHSQGWDWFRKNFATQEEANGFLERILKVPTIDVCYHGKMVVK